jgi:hypothetical protein
MFLLLLMVVFQFGIDLRKPALDDLLSRHFASEGLRAGKSGGVKRV